jgi:hypothetical protein
LSPRERVPFSNAGNFNNNGFQVGQVVPMIESNRYNGNGYPYQGPQNGNNLSNKQQQFNFKSPRSQSQVNSSS